ncbi:hypothetical protein [Streptomyces sp. NPDC094466]|uniref:hypothetical protein n=1 Tax=Streptomyces sp. NPDC094466 TaxID=3366065 RepID=UPI0037F957D9
MDSPVPQFFAAGIEVVVHVAELGGGRFCGGRDGHTGPKYPSGTQVCVQFKGLSTKACVTLK